MALEANLRVKLMTRSTRQLSLTEAGQTYLDWAREAIAGQRKLVERLEALQDAPAGRIAVAMDAWLAACYMPEILREFRKLHPQIVISVLTSGDPASRLGIDCDLAICAGKVPPSHLVGLRAYEYRRVICASPRYIKEFGAPQSPLDLAKHRCLDHASSQSWHFRSSNRKVTSVEIDAWAVVDSWFVLRSMAVDGLGIARMGGPLTIADIESGLLQRVMPEYESVDADGADYAVWIIHPGSTPPLRVRVFSRFALKCLRQFASAPPSAALPGDTKGPRKSGAKSAKSRSRPRRGKVKSGHR